MTGTGLITPRKYLFWGLRKGKRRLRGGRRPKGRRGKGKSERSIRPVKALEAKS